MAYLTVEDFRAGMDRRRKRVAGTPGALWSGKNVHITSGGDIERRKKFVPEYEVEDTFGLAAIRGQPYVFGSADLASSMPIGIQYQRLEAPGAPAMTAVLAAKSFRGQFYVIAEYADGSVYHFLDGTRVTDWDIVATDNASFETVARLMADKLEATSDVSATSFGDTATITAVTAGTGFTIVKSTGNGGSVNDQDILLTTVQANVVEVEEVLASVEVEITGGTADPDTNYLESILINGVEVLSGNVAWEASNATTAIRLAADINFGSLSHGYSAVVVGTVVTISAAIGTGVAPNGYIVDVLQNGDFAVSAGAVLDGGVAAVTAQKQVVTAKFQGTFEVGDSFTLTVNGIAYTITGKASGTGRTIHISDSRVWSPVGSLWRYCMLNRADVWDPASGVTDADAGFINISSEIEGNEDLIVATRYQDRAAIFSESNITLYQLDTDPANFAFSETLDNTGTRAPDSVIRYGNNDVFYLDVTGIRSLRARDSSNTPFVSDIGNAIDSFVQDQMATRTTEKLAKARGGIEPVDGRYLLFVDNLAFVLSYFPGAKISAWTYYDLEEFDGELVQSVIRVGGRFFVRAGNFIYVYGGLDGDTYPGDDEILGEIELPFLSGKTPATIKNITGFDCAAVNVWAVDLAFDPNDETDEIAVGNLSRITFAEDQKVPAPGRTSMVAPKLVCDTAGPASVSMLAIHYETDEAG
jgi:hypothetical protein